MLKSSSIVTSEISPFDISFTKDLAILLKDGIIEFLTSLVKLFNPSMAFSISTNSAFLLTKS